MRTLSQQGNVVGFDGDVRDADRVDAWLSSSGVGTVIHAAAVVPVQQVHTAPANAIAVNVGGTANVAQACESHQARLVYLSTSHVYRPIGQRQSEGDPTEPSSLYGLTKLQGEQWVTRLCSNHLTLRIFSYFDPRQSADFVVPSLTSRIKSAPPGTDIEVYGWDSVRDLGSGEWVADVVAELALGSKTGTVNCGTGTGTSIGRLAQMLSTALARDDVNLTPAPSETPPNSLVADTTLLKQALGRDPSFDLLGALTGQLDAS